MSASLVSLASLVDAFESMTPEIRLAAIINRDGTILLLQHQKKGARYWVLPGGRLQAGETLEAGLKRELREELGLRSVDVGALVIVCETLAPDRNVVNLICQADIGEGDRSWTGPTRSSPAWTGCRYLALPTSTSGHPLHRPSLA